MAAEIQPKPLTRKPILLQRVEGSQEVVNMAVIVPKEEGVISVSEDRYEPLPLGREEGRDGPAVPEPASGAVPPRRRECRALSQVVIIMRILVVPVSSCASPPLRGSGKRSPDRGVLSGLARVAPAGARVALELTVHRPLDLGPAPRTGRGEGGAARPCRCVRGEDAPSRFCEITKRF